MADTVRDIMERMVPDLKDLEGHHIFSATEIKSIVKRREHDEYLIKSHKPDEQDFLRAIEYELNLERLRSLRKDRLDIQEQLVSDFSIKKRIHFIYERAVRKYRTDEKLWKQYIQYCCDSNELSKAGRIYTQFLQLFPLNTNMWIDCCMNEQNQGHYTTARILYQRGLRFLDKDQTLWNSYYRFELNYINIIKKRRELLGITSTPVESKEKEQEVHDMITSIQDDDKVDVHNTVSTEETFKDDENIQKEEDQQENTDMNDAIFLKGAIPKVIYMHCLENFPSLFSLFISFLNDALTYQIDDVYEYIYNDLINKYKYDCAFWKEMILFPVYTYMHEDNLVENDSKKSMIDISNQIEKTLVLCEEAINNISSVDIYSSLFESLYSIYILPSKYQGKEIVYDYLNKIFIQLYEKQTLSPSIYYYYSQILYLNKQFKDAFKYISEAISQFPATFKLMDIYINICIYHPIDGIKKTSEDIINEFKSFMNVISEDEKGLLYIKWLKYMMFIQYDDTYIQNTFKKAIQGIDKNQDVFLTMYLTYLHQVHNYEGLELFYTYITDHSVLVHISITLYQQFIILFKNYQNTDKGTLAHKRILQLYEQMTSIYGQSHIDLWIDYLTYLRSVNDLIGSKAIYARALHNVNDMDAFNEMYSKIINVHN